MFNCPHCGLSLSYHQCIDDDVQIPPKEGDAGLCAECLDWWVICLGRPMPYIPTAEESALAFSQLPDAIIKFQEFKRKNR